MNRLNTLTRSGIRWGAPWPKNADRQVVADRCTKQWGEPGIFKEWSPLEYSVQFREEKDRTLFLLRWGV